MKPWEIHPALVHFPIAFLMGAIVLDLYAVKKLRADLVSVAAWLRRGAAATNPTRFARGLGMFGVLVLGTASWIGGTTVYHGGMGVDPDVVIAPTDHW